MSQDKCKLYEMVGLSVVHQNQDIDQHRLEKYVFDPTKKIDIEQLNVTERMRGILLNWCRNILGIYFKKDKMILDSSFLSVKILFDYITFTLLKGQLNRAYIQLIGCACLFIAIKTTYHIIGMGKEAESQSFQLELLKKLAYFTDDSYTSRQIFDLVECIIRENRDFLSEVKDTQINYINLERVKIKFSDSDDSDEYKSPTDPKWETFLREINHKFMTVVKDASFIRLLRLRSFGIMSRMSDSELISHPNLNEMFEVMIECANEIIEQVVFNTFNHRLTKNSSDRLVFAFTCLLIAIKQQGAFDWVYDQSGLTKHFASLLSYNVKKINSLEIMLLTLTDWKGCPNIETRMELKYHKDALLQLDKKIFEFGKRKMKSMRNKGK